MKIFRTGIYSKYIELNPDVRFTLNLSSRDYSILALLMFHPLVLHSISLPIFGLLRESEKKGICWIWKPDWKERNLTWWSVNQLFLHWGENLFQSLWSSPFQGLCQWWPFSSFLSWWTSCLSGTSIPFLQGSYLWTFFSFTDQEQTTATHTYIYTT